VTVAPGFEAIDCAPGRLLADSTLVHALRASGLDDVRGWQTRLEAGVESAGRGATARLVVGSDAPLLLKQLRRGGLAGPLWCDRFAGTRRLLDNLEIPLEAIRRGVSTPRPVALFLLEGPRGLYRGWFAQVEIPDAVSLSDLVVADTPPSGELLIEAMRAVRAMHDGGVEHRDLNLGNLLVERATGVIWIVDMDNARLHPRPLAVPLRQRALRRLERSWVKTLARCGRTPDGRGDGWYERYAGEDAGLADRLARGRAAGRLWLRLHRLTWR
jgi:hypothetical protein